jgi:hypothetical protein
MLSGKGRRKRRKNGMIRFAFLNCYEDNKPELFFLG